MNRLKHVSKERGAAYLKWRAKIKMRRKYRVGGYQPTAHNGYQMFNVSIENAEWSYCVLVFVPYW